MAAFIEVTDEPTDVDKLALLAGLKAFNEEATGLTMRPMAVMLRDASGRLLGGWLFSEYFWLTDEQCGPGTGSELMRRAEQEAEAAGCIGAWLDTFSFQAPDFYRRHG